MPTPSPAADQPADQPGHADASDARGAAAAAAERLFAGPGEVRALARGLDWAATPLGPVGGWPASLRTAVRICLGTRFPMAVLWGPALAMVYNDAYCAILGAKHPGALGRPASEAWTEVWAESAAPLAAVLAGGPATWYEDRPLTLARRGASGARDGAPNAATEVATFTYSLSPIPDDAGGVGGVLVVVVETTARARAEAQLRQSEARARALVAHLPSGAAFVVGHDLRYVQAGGEALRAAGLSPDDVVGRTVAEVVGPDLQALGESTYRRALAGEAFAHEHEERGHAYVTHGVPLRGADGRVEAALAVSYDITERKRAEAVLQASEARQAFLLALSDALRPLADPLAVRRAAARLVGGHVGADRVLYAEITDDGETIVIGDNFVRDGGPGLVGRYPVATFGTSAATLGRGETLVLPDVGAYDAADPVERAALEALEIRAALLVPLVKHGRWVAAFCLYHRAPHAWTTDEVRLAEAVAECTWAAVERARAEAALRANEARQAFLLALSDALRPVGDAVAVQTVAAQLLGEHLGVSRCVYAEFVVEGGREWVVVAPEHRAPGTASFAGRHPADQFGPDVPTLRAGRDIVVSDTEAEHTEIEPAPDGGAEALRAVWRALGVRARCAVPLIKDGRLVGAFGVQHAAPRAWTAAEVALLREVAERTWDAVERARAEAALRESEARYRLIVDGARDYAFLTTDVDGRITSWSPGAEAVFGWTEAEAVGQPAAITFTPEDRAAGVPEAERAKAGADDLAPDVRWHQRKDGGRVFVDGSLRAVRGADGAPRHFLKVAQNVTRRREADEALRASEARYRTLVENVQDYAIFPLDARGVVTGWTPGAERVTGYTPAEALGQPLAFLYPPEDVAAGVPERHLAAAAASGRGEWEGWRVRRDGTRFWADEVATAVRDGDGRLVGFTKISRDLTERHLAQAAAEQAQLAAARDELRRALARSEEAERRRLARELHDRLGQHLTALALGLAEARRRLAGAARTDASLGRLEELARVMSRDARNLALELRPPELDDVGLVSAIETYVREWAARTGVAADVAVTGLPDRPPSPDVGSALYRILQEALTNVAKHARATRVSVIVEQPDDDRPAAEVGLIVEDDGQGFDPDATAVRVRAERRLGLAGMRERAALAGGTLSVESRPGGGTTVFARLPVEPADGEADGAAGGA